MANYEEQSYCKFDASAANAVAGKSVLVCIFDETGVELLATTGQQGLTINRSADSIEVGSKDSGGWKNYLAGLKEWSIDTDGLYVASDAAMKLLNKYFYEGGTICVKVVNVATYSSLFGGLATITDLSVEAPFDDAMTYSATFQGKGELFDLSEDETATQMPKGYERPDGE